MTEDRNWFRFERLGATGLGFADRQGAAVLSSNAIVTAMARINVAGFLAAVVVLTASSCGRTWRAETKQPPLLLDAADELRVSRPNVILLGHMELPRTLLMANSAYFVVVNKDRLRFHVSMVHRWEQIADPREWRAYLEDSFGNRTFPESVEGAPVKAYNHRLWRPGNITYPVGSVLVYKGFGDFVFHDRDLFSDALSSLTFVMYRPTYGYTYRYSWQFVEGEFEAGEATVAIATDVASAN